MKRYPSRIRWARNTTLAHLSSPCYGL
jgi:hypothetical protein